RPGGELCLDETFTREGANDVSTSSAPPNPPLQRTNASVATLPLAFAAERPYRWADEEHGMSRRLDLIQFGSLGSEHFKAFPVWVSCHSVDFDEEWFDETDEETFRPWTGSLPVKSGRWNVPCSLGNGTSGWQHTVGVRHASGSGRGVEPRCGTATRLAPGRDNVRLWFGFRACDETARAGFYAALRTQPAQVFPARFAAEDHLRGRTPVTQPPGRRRRARARTSAPGHRPSLMARTGHEPTMPCRATTTATAPRPSSASRARRARATLAPR